MNFLRKRLGLVAAVAVGLMLLPAVATVVVVWLGGSGEKGGAASGLCADAAYRVTTSVAASSEVFLELELIDPVAGRTWQVRWRDDRFGSHTFDLETDEAGHLETRTVMGDTDDGDMLREVSFRPVGSEGWCTVQGHID